jgi:ADYC domain
LLGPSLAACVAPPEVGDEPATGVTTQFQLDASDVDCDPLICPGNSDIIAALGPYELSTNPARVSPRGYRLLSIRKGGVQLAAFDVAGATLTGAMPGPLPASPPIPIGGPPDFIGTRFRVQEVTSGQIIDLSIEAYQYVPFFDVTRPVKIVGFMMKYQRISPVRGEKRDLCPYKDELGSNQAKTWTVFWKGDRYNPDTGHIYASGLGLEATGHVGDWFNISCAGEATIKMLRTEIGNAVRPGSPQALSQSTLNMFTAKYCPDATRYTKLGQKLSWNDKWSTSSLGLFTSYEAIWTPTGAACLRDPRMVDIDEIECKIDECTDDMIDNWSLYGNLRSANPLVLVAQPPPPVFLPAP